DVLTDEVDTGTATVHQLLSSILPGDTPVQGKDKSGDVAPSGGTSLFNVNRLVTGLGQTGQLSSIFSNLLTPMFFGVSSSATSIIQPLGPTAITADGAVDIESASTPSAEAQTPGLLPAYRVGVTYADSEGVAQTTLGAGTTVNAGSAFTLNALVTNEMQSQAEAMSGLILPTTQLVLNCLPQKAGPRKNPRYGTTKVKIAGPAIAVAYGKGVSTSAVHVEQGASVHAGGAVTIAANNTNEFEVSATSTSVAPGQADTIVGDKQLPKLL